MSLSLVAFATETTRTPNATVNYTDTKKIPNGIITHKQVVKEAADVFKATEMAYIALDNNQPKQALDALEVISGKLNLLLARKHALGQILIDFQVEVLKGVTDLKSIKKLQDELGDFIDNGHYQAARPIVDSLVDEIRITTVYLPLTTYPAVIDQITPLVDAGKLEEAKHKLLYLLNTYVSEQEVTPLAIIRAEEKLTKAFHVEHKSDLPKQKTKNKTEKLVRKAEQNIKVAQALGYGTKDDNKVLYDSIDALKKANGNADFKDEWAKIKKSLSAFKNIIVHPRR